MLKCVYPKLFHVTCIDNLLYNCTMKVTSQFHDVDQIVAKVKAATGKNKARQVKFATIVGHPACCNPTWEQIKSCHVLFEILTRSKSGCGNFKGSGVLITQVKVGLLTPDLTVQRLKIRQQYKLHQSSSASTWWCGPQLGMGNSEY